MAIDSTEEPVDTLDRAPSPEVAVVIPTYLRETRLAFALDGLADQTLDRDRFEVIVVRAAGAPGPIAEAPPDRPVRFLTYPGPGRAAAQRNHGWRASRAPLVAFMDDDCRPAPQWLERLLEAGAAGDVLVQGRTEPDPDERHLLHGWARSMEVVEPSEWYETCNIAYPRDVLERLGGFDEAYPRAWGEDTDLGLRARAAGVERVFAEQAVCWHAVLPRTLPGVIRDTLQRDRLAMVANHPLRRDLLYKRFFVRPRHAYLCLAIAGLIAFRHRPLLAAAAAAPYLTRTLTREKLAPRRVRGTLMRLAYHTPIRVLIDLLEMAVVARSAVRHRFPAL